MVIMAKANRYDLMNGQFIDGDIEHEWPDCLSIDLDEFPEKNPPKSVVVYQENVLRPDMFFFKHLNSNMLEDILLWLNMIPSRRDLEPGMKMDLPSFSDINRYYIENRKIN
jgi:hypothetical protein